MAFYELLTTKQNCEKEQNKKRAQVQYKKKQAKCKTRPDFFFIFKQRLALTFVVI